MRWIIFLYCLTSSSFKLHANFDGMLLATFKVIVKKVGLLFSGHDLVILRNVYNKGTIYLLTCRVGSCLAVGGDKVTCT